MDIIITILIITMAILIFFLVKNYKNTSKLNQDLLDSELNYNKLLSQKKSSEIRLGQISENLAPFLKEFKYNPKKTHFIGMPIDYIIFEEDKIIFLEIKSGKSSLTPKQNNIKNLINQGKIIWDEMRIN